MSDVPAEISADLLVVGGGIAGITAAIEASEVGQNVVLVEKEPYIGGRVARMNLYFPKMCPPQCGLEINLKRLRQNDKVRILTLAEVQDASGEPGNYEVKVLLNPRYINDNCTACGDCEKACSVERDDDFNYGLTKTKAFYLPFENAYPVKYVLDPQYVNDPAVQEAAKACQYDAIDLNMQPQTVTVKAKAIVWATGWKPYDANNLDLLGYKDNPNVITNVEMERYASSTGPTKGKIVRPSDGKEISSIAFVQCAGSRDENHLPYCSGVCCLASIKQAKYVREQYPEAEINIFYIDVRTLGRMEDFYQSVEDDEKMVFHRGKVADVSPAGNGNLKVKAEDTLTGKMTEKEVEMVVLATGVVPNTDSIPSGLNVQLDEWGFIPAFGTDNKLIGTGMVIRPMEVAATVQDATGAAVKALIVQQEGR